LGLKENGGNMKGIRLGRRCLLALMVLGAIAATTASAAEYEVRALPELGRCVKVPIGTGEYKGALCITHEVAKGERGKYNWVQANATENLTFEGAGIEVKLATSGRSTIECVVANVKGTITGPKTATAEIELQGCKNTNEELCHGVGAENQIKSLPLEAELGFIRNEVVEGHRKVKVGLDFKPQPPLTSLMSYQCGSEPTAETAAVEGSVIVSDKPIDKMTTENKLNFHVLLKGTQDPEKFENGLKDTLTTTFTKGIETTSAPTTLGMNSYVGKYSVPLEIKAIEK
jgi:hypothetical protein